MQIPNFILDFKSITIPAAGKYPEARWVNAFSNEFIGRDASNLYATETLFGNWNGELLLLAQDALPAPSLTSVIDFHLSRGEARERAWRHADRLKYKDKGGWKTNEALCELMAVYAPNMGAVYGSAAAHMIYDNGQNNYSQDLRGYYTPELQAHLVNVLRWVVANMPNLKFIMCLGNKAWELVDRTANVNSKNSFQEFRDHTKHMTVTIGSREIIVVPTYHPAARVSKSNLEKNWNKLQDLHVQ